MHLTCETVSSSVPCVPCVYRCVRVVHWIWQYCHRILFYFALRKHNKKSSKQATEKLQETHTIQDKTVPRLSLINYITPAAVSTYPKVVFIARWWTVVANYRGDYWHSQGPHAQCLSTPAAAANQHDVRFPIPAHQLYVISWIRRSKHQKCAIILAQLLRICGEAFVVNITRARER